MSARRQTKGATRITDALLRKWPLPEPDGARGKEDRGKVLVVGGSEEIPGAVVLAALAALRAGAGTLQIATARSVARAMAIAVPEARVIGLPTDRNGELGRGCARALREELGECSALLIGPGMRDPSAAIELLRRCVGRAQGGALVIDAGSLDAFRGRKPLSTTYRGGIVATPHAGEMAHLWGVERDQVLAEPLALARQAAAKLRIVLALKGAETFVVAPDGTAFHNTAGNVGLGTSGSGDTLSGVIAGLCARGATPLQAAVWGVYLHAKAGDALARAMGPLGFLARELLAEIPRQMRRLSR